MMVLVGHTGRNKGGGVKEMSCRIQHKRKKKEKRITLKKHTSLKRSSVSSSFSTFSLGGGGNDVDCCFSTFGSLAGPVVVIMEEISSVFNLGYFLR
jgi:hypothetical protein